MALRDLWLNAFGYVIIKIQGKHPEKFLNAASRRGLQFWDVEKLRPDFLVAKTTVAHFRRVRSSCRQAGVRVEIMERGGLPFLLARLGSRAGLILGGLACCGLIIYLSTFVWFIEIEGNEYLDNKEILEILAEEGLRPGISRLGLETGRLERNLVNRLPRVAWAGITIQGTLARVQVVEKTFSDEALALPGDIVATRDGLIVNIMAFSGTPLVRPGDTVREGQLLISGALGRWHPDYYRLLREGRPPYLRAEGIVEARVWYEETVMLPLNRIEFALTGNRIEDYELYIHRWVWSRGKENPFRYFEEERQVKRLPGPLAYLPVEWHHVLYEELAANQMRLTRREALQQARRAAKESLDRRLPEMSTILSEMETVLEESGKIGVRLVRETREKIGQFRPIPRETGVAADTNL
ncbi:MAG: sporulation protein YqfD [Limnochordia bacterium]|jgi:similar to stage IV sporulation protein